MHVQLWQMLLIIAYGFFINYDKNGTMIGTSQPVTAGLIVGLIMGDLKTGLYIGATLQLMTLGISSFGGASVPDYQTAALVGSYIAISTKQDASIGITLAIPVAMLMVQLDVLKWSINIFFPFAAFTASAIASIRLKALKSRQQIISASDISLSANSL